MAQTVNFRLLGTPRLTRAGVLVTLPLKQVGLLALLASEPNGRLSRGKAANRLWPRASVRSARHSLSQAIYFIRKTLGEGILVADANDLLLQSIETDLEGFLASVEVADWESARALVAGDFLEDFEIPDSPAFEHWLDQQRYEIGKLIDLANQESFSSTGSHGLLSDDRSGETVAPLEQSVFVGRTTETAVLRESWKGCTGGRTTVVLVRGSPGIGKTTLCSRMARWAVLQGAKVLAISGFEAEQRLGLGAFGQILEQLESGGHLNVLDDPWRGIVGHIQEQISGKTKAVTSEYLVDADLRMAGALQHVFEKARPTPVLLVVDDVQWIDSTSLGIIHYLARTAQDLPLFVLLSGRPEATTVEIALKWPLEVTLELQGLGVAESTHLAMSLAPLGSEQGLVDSVVQLSQGNPLMIRALLASRPSDSNRPGDGAESYLTEQVRHLTQSAQLVGASLAIIGGPASASRLMWLTEFTDSVASAGIDELVAHGYATYESDEARFSLRHSMIGEAFLSALDTINRARLHRRAGLMFQEQGYSSAVVATQFAIAGSKREGFRAAMAAGSSSLSLFAYREAEYFFKIAVIQAYSATTEVKSRIALADLLLQLGRAREASEVLRSMSPDRPLQPRTASDIQAYLHLADLAHSSSLPTLLGAADFAREAANRLDGLLAARLYVSIGSTATHYGLTELASDSASAALQVLEPGSSDPRQIKYEVLALAGSAMWGDRRPSINRLSEIIDLVDGSPGTLVSALLARASAHHVAGNGRMAQADLRRAYETCERYGLVSERLRVAANLAVTHMELGEWAQSVVLLEDVQKRTTAAGIFPNDDLSAFANLQIVRYETAAYEEAVRIGDSCLTFVAPRSQFSILGVSGLSHLQLGQLGQARECESRIRPLVNTNDRWSHDVSYVEIFLARMSAVAGARDQAITRLTEMVKLFSARDVYCALRMETELLRLQMRESGGGEALLERANTLRARLLAAEAVTLIDSLDSVIHRVRIS